MDGSREWPDMGFEIKCGLCHGLMYFESERDIQDKCTDCNKEQTND